MKISILFFAVFGFFSMANASGKIIVRLKPGVSIETFRYLGQKVKAEVLVEDLGIYAIDVPGGRSLERTVLDLQKNNQMLYAQEDHPITLRQAPNDKNFSQQWDMKWDATTWGIDALGSWGRFGIGGLDPAGQDIVVAVVDGGVDLTHQDLKNNIWVNKGEIAGNGIDDDGNGYVDDLSGWNAYDDNGDVTEDDHGTHVSGTVGAVGNNSIGIAGINWNVKIMAVNGATSSTAIVLKAYGYVLKQKKLWIQSGGKKGANVVATNSSFGVDYGNCNSKEFAAWNDIYNEMGKVGILHAIATANLDIDVDVKGDVPTGCDSPYIISVTNTLRDGSRSNVAAHGLKTIDIGAPGTGIYSTIPGNSYTTMSGTSMASPHVAGAVAYMHSASSSHFSSIYLQNPADGALALKKMMLDSVSPAPSLKGQTVSGGILNLNKASEAISLF